MLMLKALCCVSVCLVYVHGQFSLTSISYDYDYKGKGGGGGGGGGGGKTVEKTVPIYYRTAYDQPYEYAYPETAATTAYDVPYEYAYPETAATTAYDVPYEYVYPETAETTAYDVPYEYEYPVTAETIAKDVPYEYVYPETAETTAYDVPFEYAYPETAETTAYDVPYEYAYPETAETTAYDVPYEYEYPAEESTLAPNVTEQPTVTVAPTTTEATLTTTLRSIYDRPLNFYQFNCVKNVPLWIPPNPPTRFEMTRKLYFDLLTGYDTRIRPLQNQSRPIYVNTKFVPLTLIEFDTFQQRFSLLAYIRIRWYDELMMWRPKYYMCMSSIKVSTTGLWTPNIVIHKVN